MSDSSDPSVHRQRERQFVEHVERLLRDDRLRVDTLGGKRPVSTLRRDVVMDDHEVDLKRLMSEMGIPDRELQSRMPIGREMTVTLSRTTFWLFKKTVGRIKVVCLSPRRELLEGEAPRALSSEDVKSALERSTDYGGAAPTTVVVVGTSGFDRSARQMAERRSGKTIVLAEPNDAGGWTISAPEGLESMAAVLDPEVDSDKRSRVREELDKRKAELLAGGLGADKVAEATKLPLGLVEDELQSYAKEAGGYVARRVEGSVLLFREGSGASAAAGRLGGPNMPFMDRMKNLFARKGDNEKKIALLSERRAALSVQRDRSFEEMGVLESRESELREQFKATTSTITKKRVTSQLVQLRKDLERRQQLLGVLNQQINVVSTHLHNLELVAQGQSAALPDSEELAQDAAAAEEVLAELQANSELAGSISVAGGTGLSDEEQALYDELEREASGKTAEAGAASPSPMATAQPMRSRTEPQREATEPPPLSNRNRDRGAAEPG